MKNHINTIVVIFCFLLPVDLLFGQSSNVILFSENGERFSVILNGILQNETPETNIKISNLPAPSYKLKILFEDPKIDAIDKTLMMGNDLEITYCIQKTKKGEYVVRFQNQVEIYKAPPPPPSQHVIGFSTVPPASSTVVQNQTTVTNINSVNASGGNVNITINTGTTNSQTVNPPDHYVMPGYNGSIGCPYPITDLDFKEVKRVITEKSFEDSKLKIARQVTSSNCLFAAEVKEIMELFSFEDSRLEYAKFAYRYTYDIGNYYKVNDAFKFESSIDELNDFIQGGSRE